ncbi:condensation domain-containing protein, partial [Phenylobacterium sp.]|uniref:condensation domain-containing protein n=1 Tax=Phenylobacterium sp. TaxID=1871053 RepID=UPI002FC9C07B
MAPDDDFFDLGGDSLAAVQMSARSREIFGVEVPVQVLFDAPRLGQLSAWLIEQQRRARAEVESPLGLVVVGSAADDPNRLIRHSERPPAPRLGDDRDVSTLPLSFGQERLWFLDQMGLSGAAYNMGLAVRLEGALDIAALEATLTELVRRHESLRTRFENLDGVGVQVVDPAGVTKLGVEELGPRQDPADQEAQIATWIRDRRSQRFDLERGPPFRAQLLRLEPQAHVLSVSLHHIVADGWSMGVLRRELSELYQAHLEERGSQLSEPDLRYADYALWQRSWLQGETLGRQLDYWRECLSNAPLVLELPTDRPRPAAASFQGASHRFELPEELTTRLRGLARREGATLFMALLAGFQAILSRWSRQSEVVVGTSVAGRAHRQLEGLIGFFTNTLALRTRVDEGDSFQTLLRRVRETSLEAYAHQDMPFEKLVAELAPSRDLSRAPIFQAMCVLQNAPAEPLNFAGLKTTAVSDDVVTVKHDLTLMAWETGPGLRLTLDYATELFDEATVARFAQHLVRLFEQVSQEPELRLAAVDLLSAEERHQVVEAWNATDAAYPRDLCVHQLFEAQVLRDPEA